MTARRALFATLVSAACISCASRGSDSSARPDPVRFALVPAPVSLVPGSGAFHITANTRVVVNDTVLLGTASLLGGALRASTGAPITIAAAQPGSGDIELRLEARADTAREAYRLEVRPNRVVLSARTAEGVFRGTQSIRQLLDPQHNELPVVTITDAPRFAYRGMHLDVSRHIFPVEFIRKYIDLLALYKFNTFHWHLTDDQGWRLEIMKYPRLTEVGAWRKETIVAKNFDPYVGDGQRYGGFYTQEQVREIVAYAAARHITIIPEIEMPGHSVAALAAYPELGCTPGPFEVHTRWGVTDDIFCPHERTFEFLENVLTEVMALFPSPYIHIGGDEAPKGAWERSPVAQEVIRREGLKDEHELQSWFVQRIERFLNAHNRRLIGWDEILEGGLAPNATVMSWRGTAGGVAAASQGHDVIMTPNSDLYFDYYQGPPATEPLAIGGNITLAKVYTYEPVPPGLTPDAARHIRGAQANVWTEYITTSDHVEYMVLPRMLALSEVVWSPNRRRDWTDFQRRLPVRLRELSALGYRFRPPDGPPR